VTRSLPNPYDLPNIKQRVQTRRYYIDGIKETRVIGYQPSRNPGSRGRKPRSDRGDGRSTTWDSASSCSVEILVLVECEMRNA